MDPGQRTEQVAFQRIQSMADGAGGRTETWVVIGRAWASAKHIGSGEAERDGSVRTTNRYRFTVLSAAIDELKLTTRDRIVWGDDALNIRERPRRLQTTPETELVAEMGVTT